MVNRLLNSGRLLHGIALFISEMFGVVSKSTSHPQTMLSKDELEDLQLLVFGVLPWALLKLVH